MPYNDTPLPTETPAQSQPLMRQNFQQIATSYNTDHISLSSGANVGFSNKLTLVDQGATPPGAVAGSDVLYARTVSGLIELFLQRPAGTPIQLTSGNPIISTNGASFLPGGIIIQWMQGTQSSSNQLFAFPMPFPNAVFSIVATDRNGGLSPTFYTITGSNANGFNINSTAQPLPRNFFIIAIGN